MDPLRLKGQIVGVFPEVPREDNSLQPIREIIQTLRSTSHRKPWVSCSKLTRLSSISKRELSLLKKRGSHRRKRLQIREWVRIRLLLQAWMLNSKNLDLNREVREVALEEDLQVSGEKASLKRTWMRLKRNQLWMLLRIKTRGLFIQNGGKAKTRLSAKSKKDKSWWLKILGEFLMLPTQQRLKSTKTWSDTPKIH